MSSEGAALNCTASRRNQRRSPPGAYRYRLLCDPGNRTRNRLRQPSAPYIPAKEIVLLRVQDESVSPSSTSTNRSQEIVRHFFGLPLLPPFANRLNHHTLFTRLIPTDPRFHPMSSNGPIVICQFLRVSIVVRNFRHVVLPLG